jgi:hypothetical protein
VIDPGTGALTVNPPQGVGRLTLRIEARDANGNVRFLEIELELDDDEEESQGQLLDNRTFDRLTLDSPLFEAQLLKGLGSAGKPVDDLMLADSTAFEHLPLDQQIALELDQHDNYGVRLVALVDS